MSDQRRDQHSESPVGISAVIPTFNRAHLIARAIESVKAQNHPPSEIIVVDDGSTDGTEAVLAGIDGITVVVQKNGGVSAARNAGARVATSPWVAFLDSDDLWLPGHLETLAAAVDGTDGAADLYFSNLEREVADGNGGITSALLWDQAGFASDSPWEANRDATEWFLLPRHPAMVQSSMFSRERYIDIGGCAERLRTREDTHLFFRLTLGRTVCAVNHVGNAAEGGRKRRSAHA